LDGYGAFVWPSYGATFLVLGLAILFSLRGHARAQAELRRLEKEAP
jgi:heme exporter protein CcmD